MTKKNIYKRLTLLTKYYNMKYRFLILTTVLSTLKVFSQCQTDHYHKEAIKNNPQIIQEQNQFYDNINYVNSQKRATKYIIPVVFHVIHTNGPENISLAQIENQIKILNEDFSLNNPNKTNIRSVFTNVAADCQIEFKLAKLDPNGKCTDGVNRIFSGLHVDARDNVKSIANARWDNKKYLNIWTVSSISSQSGADGTTLGFAYLPQAVAQGLSAMDGIVCRADYVGVIGTGNVSGAGRTLTHEVGHYLGLLHTFEDGCSGTGSNNGDRCADTPPVLSTFTNANCPANGNSCSTDGPNLIDQWENYMDYSSGSCQSMFSNNQKAIMHSVLENYSFRKNLWSNSNLIAVGLSPDVNSAPIASFGVNNRTVCVGELVKFTDLSCKATVVNRTWTFVGANITGTNIESPEISYNAPGKYKVTLEVSNSKGNNSISIDEYITVLPRVAINRPTVRQEFEDPLWDLHSGWLVLDKESSKFNRETTTGFKSNSSIVAPINNTAPKGQRFQMITPPINIRPVGSLNPKLSMMIGYRRVNANSSESIRLYYSVGCNQNWTQFLFRNANFISAEPNNFSSGFKPSTDAHWKLLSASLNQFQNDSNVSFMIEVESGTGNSVYIDNINVGVFNSNINDIENQINLNVYPNPTSGELNINYINTTGETEVWLENIEGKKIAQITEKSNETGTININFKSDLNINSGIYILKIKANEQIINKKVIFAD